MKTSTTILLAMLICSATALAQVPATFNYQGVLLDADLEPVPDGDYQVTISRDGLATVTKSAVTVRAPFRPVVEIEMVPGPPPERPAQAAGPGEPFSLTGQVLNRDRNPVPDVLVRMAPLDRAGDPVRMRTGEDGFLGCTIPAP